MKRSKIRISFKSKNQLPLLMIIEEYYDNNGELYYAESLFEIWLPFQKRELEKKLREFNMRNSGICEICELDTEDCKCTMSDYYPDND